MVLFHIDYFIMPFKEWYCMRDYFELGTILVMEEFSIITWYLVQCWMDFVFKDHSFIEQANSSLLGIQNNLNYANNLMRYILYLVIVSKI